MIGKSISQLKKILWAAVIGLCIFVSLAVINNVSVEITQDDRTTFSTISIPIPAKPTTQTLTYDAQIALIRKLQAEVFERAPLLPGDTGIPLYENREPKDLFKHRHGLCFDRSRSLDKLLNYYRFETRHVYILYKENKSFLGALLGYAHPSHAVTEVKTSKGWLLVDSNDPWIALTNGGEPVDAYQAQFHVNEFANMPEYFKKPYWVIVGLYSKRGQFYSSYSPFPELNWPTFFHWLKNG